MPPNDPGQPGHDPSAHDGPDPDRYEQNPYARYGRPAADETPDLDADAPVLTVRDAQRLNRRALIFLGLIVLVLMALAYFFFFRGSKSDTDAAKAPQKQVEVPDLPAEATPLPQLPDQTNQTPPIDLASAPPMPTEGIQPQGDEGRPPMPTILERRLLAEQQADAGGGAPPGGFGETGDDQLSTAQNLNNPDALLVRGTFIRCVLETRIITDVPGFTSCIVTEPVYSVNGRKLLLPKGSKVMGSYDSDANSPRVAVVWDRILTPNGYDINMKSPGVDGLGSAGYKGRYSAHWPSRMASALMISLVADLFKYEAAEHGPPAQGVTEGGVVVQNPYESVTAQSMQQLAQQALQRSINRPATVTINQGTVVNVYVAKDVDFTGVLPTTTAYN